MEILFLDDQQFRHNIFGSMFPETVHVYFAWHAIGVLPTRAWDIVSLDHDLTGPDHEDSARPTSGMEVVRMLCAKSLPIQHIWIHTHNEKAGLAMCEMLTHGGYQAIYLPFTWTLSKNWEPGDLDFLWKP